MARKKTFSCMTTAGNVKWARWAHPIRTHDLLHLPHLRIQPYNKYMYLHVLIFNDTSSH